MSKTCAACGSDFSASKANARYCSDKCRKRAHRLGRAKAAVAPTSGAPGSVVQAVREALGDVTNTAQGQIALVLAARLDDPAKETGASMAAVARQLTLMLADLISPPKAASDPLDELRQKRLAMMDSA
jgi:hypothetical protein